MLNQPPAILGGSPSFAETIPMVRPTLPSYCHFEHEVKEILHSGHLTKGKYLKRLEAYAADLLEVKHVVAVSSCTSALMLTYQALGLTGDIIMPSFTFMATLSSAVWAGCRPVFVDVDLETTNILHQQIEDSLTPETTAIVAVHNYGNPADCEALESIAQKHNLRLVFDAAHALGSTYGSTPIGGQGDAQCFSLSPTKLATGGEGGLIATNHTALAEAIQTGREYGNNGKYDSIFAGLNARMPEFNAILAYHSLLQLKDAVDARNRYAKKLQARLEKIPGVKCQRIEQKHRSSFKDFSLTLDAEQFGLDRDTLRDALLHEGIQTRAYYDPPLHQQTAYRHFGKTHLPNTEWLSRNILTLPLWSEMSDPLLNGICDAMEKICMHSAAIRTAP